MPVFEYKAEVPVGDGTVEDVTVKFKDFALVPLKIWWDYGDDPERQLKEKLRWGLTDEELEKFLQIPESHLTEMFAAWQEAAKVPEGESNASPQSSKNTVRHSKRTSSATDSD